MVLSPKCFIKTFLFLLCLLSPLITKSQEKNRSFEDPFILILSSYNPDTRRVAGFISELEKALYENGNPEIMLIENLGYQGIQQSGEWKEKMRKVLLRYNKPNLKGILLLGQEAWSSFLNQDTLHLDVPFYACFASNNVLELPQTTLTPSWEPVMFDGQNRCKQIGNGGGYLNHYDIEANIRLIQSLYPNTTHIAFLSDNSYGGIALQTLVKKEMAEKFPNLDLILLDSRKNSVPAIKQQIKTLPLKTVILIGTWRIDRNGLYFSRHTLQEIIPEPITTPVFSISGLGIGSVAIGGYIPDYDVDAYKIANELFQGHPREKDSATIFWTKNQYVFDKATLQKFGIRDYQLPSNSIIEDNLENTIKEYQDYIFLALFAVIVLILISIRMFLTEQKLKHQQGALIKALAKAEQSEKLKSAFLANMSHEIRTPLNAIIGFSELLIDSDNRNERKLYGEIILHNNESLLKLINDLLDLSKIEAGYIEFSLMDICLNDFFDNLYVIFSQRMQPGVELINECPDQKVIATFDYQRLTQIMSNYLSNAIKFTPSGSIRFGYELIPEGVRFYVKDTGIGIAANDQDKIFSRFQRFDSSAQGTGLGLSICKAIAEAAEGHVGFETTYQTGSCFWISLPCEVKIDKKKSIPAECAEN